MGAPIKVAIFAGKNSYTRQLLNAVDNVPSISTIYYGPKGLPLGKSITFSGFKNEREVWTTYRYFFQIISQVIKDKPDFLHIVFTLTEFGNSYLSNFPLPFLIIFLKLLGCKIVLTIHDTVTKKVLQDSYQLNPFFSTLIWIALIIYYKLLSFSNVIIVHLNVQNKMLIDDLLITSNNICVVPFGVADPPRIDPVLDKYWKERFNKKNIVLFFGSIAPRKGLEYLIESFLKIDYKKNNLFLVVAGKATNKDQEYLNQILIQAKRLKDQNVFSYLGPLSEEDAHTLLNLSYVVVLPYVFSYATTSVLYWILQHKKPVFSSNIETLREELSGYPDELLFSPRNTDELVEVFNIFLTSKKISNQAKKVMNRKATEQSWKKIGEVIREIYKSLFQPLQLENIKQNSRDGNE